MNLTDGGVVTKTGQATGPQSDWSTATDAELLSYMSRSGKEPAVAQAAWAEKEKIAVPLLADYEHKVAQAYGIVYDSFLPQMNLGMGGVAKRSAFVVDKQGVIRYAEINDDPGKLPNFDAIKRVLSQLK